MRVPPFERFRPFMQLAAVFAVGMIVGSVIYNSLFHASYNHLWTENRDLQLRLAQSEEDLKTLKKYNKRQTVIKEIKIRIEDQDPPLNELAVKEVTQKLQKELSVLRGRSMFEIDSDSKMARTLLDRKLYEVREKKYVIQIRTMLVSEGVLQIWLDMRPEKTG
ncbi:hypothetical protein DCC85_07395 [Paenibacillus sp. CAA11]|uniref:hypothetical protein n=1 Tax=Paenibacillus sp. CAA11 TaxID=1532905 RepID=UPI000D37C1ED|nr:hypothetical protein [Paenibacillus sp. CAA11]AWB44056.1 hypothetical protein DCC85_07395 [Paenibacillus sp. CAA11]